MNSGLKPATWLVLVSLASLSLLLMAKECTELRLMIFQLNMNTRETRKNIIQAGRIAVQELIKVAQEAIVDTDEDVSADRLKNAAATKKLAIFDAFEILQRIEEEDANLDGKQKEEVKEDKTFKGYAERRSKK